MGTQREKRVRRYYLQTVETGWGRIYDVYSRGYVYCDIPNGGYDAIHVDKDIRTSVKKWYKDVKTYNDTARKIKAYKKDGDYYIWEYATAKSLNKSLTTKADIEEARRELEKIEKTLAGANDVFKSGYRTIIGRPAAAYEMAEVQTLTKECNRLKREKKSLEARISRDLAKKKVNYAEEKARKQREASQRQRQAQIRAARKLLTEEGYEVTKKKTVSAR